MSQVGKSYLTLNGGLYRRIWLTLGSDIPVRRPAMHRGLSKMEWSLYLPHHVV